MPDPGSDDRSTSRAVHTELIESGQLSKQRVFLFFVCSVLICLFLAVSITDFLLLSCDTNTKALEGTAK